MVNSLKSLHRRIQVDLPVESLARIDELVGEAGRSNFIELAVSGLLEKVEKGRSLLAERQAEDPEG